MAMNIELFFILMCAAIPGVTAIAIILAEAFDPYD